MISLSSGQGQIDFVPKPNLYFQALTQMETVVRGLELLASYYPRYVCVARK